MSENILRIQGSPILTKNLRADKAVVLNEGSARSTKTTSLIQTFILKGQQETGKQFTISRKTGPALRGSVEADFFKYLDKYGLYNEDFHHKTNRVYHMNGNTYSFLSVDQMTKIKGLSHNYAWLNEADEFTWGDYVQFFIRMTAPTNDGKLNQLFLDFNPPDEDNWIYKNVYDDPNAQVIKSTYKDNPFLTLEQIRAIESLKETDPDFWQVYGMGERAVKLEKIYTSWKKIDAWPDHIINWNYGLDFGFNHPLALMRTGYIDGVGLFWKQEVYESYLTPPDILDRFEKAGIDKDVVIKADPSRPDLISYIQDAGYTIEPAQNEVYEGILKVKGANLHITNDSPDVQQEAKKYSWKKDRNGNIQDQPVKLWDDAMDAGRYGSYELVGEMGQIRAPKSKLIRRHRR